MTRFLTSVVSLWMLCASAVAADVDAVVDALGVPELIRIFASEGAESGAFVDEAYLGGQGGDVWAETVRRLYDPTRMEQEMRAVMQAQLDPDMAEQALLFLQSDLGAKAIALEVQARQAFTDDTVEAAARSAPSAQSEQVTKYLGARALVARNTDVGVAARIAFFEGLIDGAGTGDLPDTDALRAAIAEDSEGWLRGYYALIQSAMTADEVAVLTAFWKTDVGDAVDDALFEAFGQSYVTLSYAIGQAAGRLAPQNEL
ncbi:DUF2059 domain-containing protein [uncultured Tateyamaria sp.]|uniref:DUF2059 domain-containing protein n=1 Tax=uncultured Tateyamaria sp. TaxID=455651 RepID=UPI0026361357|nr:DUF2059 domain-containing protein [uncultured Tateyamaria sp.]